MNIRSRMLKVANNLMEDVVKSFEMTEEEWKKYSELHPGADRNNHTIIPNANDLNEFGFTKEEQIKINNMKKMNEEKEKREEIKKRHNNVLNDSYDKNYLMQNSKFNPALAMDALYGISGEVDAKSLYNQFVSMDSTTHPKTLDLLSRKDKNTHSYIAQNPSTMDSTLDHIYDVGFSKRDEPYDDGFEESRFWAIIHPNTNKKTLEKAQKNGGHIGELAQKRLNGEKFPMLNDRNNDEFYKYHGDYMFGNREKTDDDDDFDFDLIFEK